MGTVYLIHFDRAIGSKTNPRGRAQHYLGYTSRGIKKRMTEHQGGYGSRLMEVVALAGIGWTLARTWKGDRALERRLKSYHKARQLCPVCRSKD